MEPARPQSWRSDSSRPSSGEGFASPTELRRAAGTHHSSQGSDPPTQAGGPGTATKSAQQPRSRAISRINPETSTPVGTFVICNFFFFLLSSVTQSRADSAWFHVPMLVYFPGCTANWAGSFVVFLPSFHKKLSAFPPPARSCRPFLRSNGSRLNLTY